MNRITGMKDVDREILRHVDDKELLQTCSINRRMWNEVCDDAFLRRRLVSKYSGIEKYKLKDETWKRFFLRFVYYTSKMRDEFEFQYTGGNFENQYSLLKSYGVHYLLLAAAIIGELSLVKYAVQKGVIPSYAALETAASYGHLELVKYLVESGVDIHTGEENALALASFHGYLDVVKYLVEQGADIHADSNKAFRYAAEAGHLPIIKYLIKHGADIHDVDEDLVHHDVVGYLRNVI